MSGLRDALINSVLLKMYETQTMVDTFNTTHEGDLETCTHFPCVSAREYADEVIEIIDGAGLTVVAKSWNILSGDAYDKLLEDLDAPPKVIPGLRDLMRRHREATAREPFAEYVARNYAGQWVARRSVDEVVDSDVDPAELINRVGAVPGVTLFFQNKGEPDA